jgi:hypothetical protein
MLVIMSMVNTIKSTFKVWMFFNWKTLPLEFLSLSYGILEVMSNGYREKGSLFHEVEVKKAHAFCLHSCSVFVSFKAGGHVMKESTKKVVSAVCYFSLFFAPFLFPIVVYFVVDDSEVMEHAKKSFLSHLLPIVAVPLGIIIVFETQYHLAAIIISALIFGTLTLIVTIWNIVKGIKVILS